MKDGVTDISSSEFRRGETFPSEIAAVEPSKDVRSKAEADEVEELDMTDVCVMADSKGSVEWTYFLHAGGVRVEDGGGIGGGFSLWTNVVVGDDGDAAAEVLEVEAW